MIACLRPSDEGLSIGWTGEGILSSVSSYTNVKDFVRADCSSVDQARSPNGIVVDGAGGERPSPVTRIDTRSGDLVKGKGEPLMAVRKVMIDFDRPLLAVKLACR